ncbi:MAG: hypothetical protein HKO93_04960 [Flavobacteriales bacterium]|nr:hypothetical protein [Flavobacteriales bacterium]
MGQVDVPIISAGIVDQSLPESHPDYGRVIASTRAVTDVVMSRSRLEELIDGEVKYLVIKLVGNTDEANNGELVKFFPEDRFKIKLSAKLETEIDISE